MGCAGGPTDLHRDDVIDAIAVAFQGASMPQTKRDLTDGGIDAQCVIEHFFGRTQADVEAGPFHGSLHMEDFTYMTDGGVLYYLPSVLRIMLRDSRDDELWLFVHGFLRHIVGEYPDRALTDLTVAQRNAIADWATILSFEWRASEWMAGCSAEAAELARLYRVTGSG